MAKKLEENYKRAVEVEVQARAQTTVLASLDKIRAPISACELTQTTFHILFANRSWAATAGVLQHSLTLACIVSCLCLPLLGGHRGCAPAQSDPGMHCVLLVSTAPGRLPRVGDGSTACDSGTASCEEDTEKKAPFFSACRCGFL